MISDLKEVLEGFVSLIKMGSTSILLFLFREKRQVPSPISFKVSGRSLKDLPLVGPESKEIDSTGALSCLVSRYLTKGILNALERRRRV